MYTNPGFFLPSMFLEPRFLSLEGCWSFNIFTILGDTWQIIGVHLIFLVSQIIEVHLILGNH